MTAVPKWWRPFGRRRNAVETQLNESEPGTAKESTPAYFIDGFARGLRVINSFGSNASRLTLSEVAKRADLTRAGARRLLLTLVELGYAGVSDRKFYLTPKILSLGHAYISSMPLWHFAQPILERLVEQANETCSMSVLDDTEVVYVLRIPVRRIMSTGVTVGSRLPAHATSMGRVLLSGLSPSQLEDYFSRADLKRFTEMTTVDPDQLRQKIEDCRSRGYDWVDSEIEHGISGLSVPVRDGSSQIAAALNISFSGGQMKEAQAVKRYLPLLREAADKMSTSLRLQEQSA